MKEPRADETLWQKTQYANLIRYKPSKKYFARIRINGKLIRRSLKTSVLSVAKLRLGDLEKKERQLAEHQTAAADGRTKFGDALAIYEQRLKGDASLKPRTREYHEQRIKALVRSWPELKQTELRNITKSDCLNWSPTFSQGRSPTAFNHTVGILRQILEIGVESGVRYDNPARFVKRLSERSEKPHLPETNQFEQFVTEIENGGGGFSKPCADLVRFMAFGGFRKTEAANTCWSDCDFARGKIAVKGDRQTTVS